MTGCVCRSGTGQRPKANRHTKVQAWSGWRLTQLYELTAPGPGDPLGNGQAQASVACATPRWIEAIERLQGPIPSLGRNASPPIPHLNFKTLAPPTPGPQAQTKRRPSMVPGIVQEVGHGPPQGDGPYPALEGHKIQLQIIAIGGSHLGQKLRQRHLHCEFSLLTPCKHQKLIGDAFQRIEIGAGTVIASAAVQAETQAQAGKRRAKVMGDPGQHF